MRVITMLSLNFKQKLIFAVTLTLAGIAYLGYVSLSSLDELDRSSQKVANLTSTGELLSSLQLQLLQTETQIAQLNPQTSASFIQSFSEVQMRFAAALQDSLGLSADTTLQQQLTQIEQQFNNYSQTLSAKINAQNTLGFNNQSGLLQPLEASAVELEEQLSLFSSLLQPFIVARQFEKEYLIHPSSENKAKLGKQIEKVIFEVKDAEFFDTFGPYIERYQAAVGEVTGAAENLAQQDAALMQVRSRFQHTIDDAQGHLKNTLLQQAKRDAQQANDSTHWTIIIVSLIVAVIISVILASTALNATRTLDRIIKQLNSIAAGNLTQTLKISNTQHDEFDQVSNAVNTMTGDLRHVIGDVANNQTALYAQARELSESVQTIATNNREVSDRSNSLASATEEISVTTDQVANRVTTLQEDSQNALDAAIDGGTIIQKAMHSLGVTAQVVEQSASQLHQLQQHSQEIDKVLVIINDLADQTNLLALNAAIEAARAGEAGRGFSVVADEVRTLAESTVKATGDITDTVRAIQQQTQSVIQVMDQSTQSIEAVKSQGDQAQEAVEVIKQRTEQAFTISAEIRSAIQDVADTTREMAVSMDQIASGIADNSHASAAIVTSSEQLEARAQSMGQTTEKFQH